MYGTIARLSPKPGAEAEIIMGMEDWQRERAPKVRGAVGEYLFKLDNGGLMLVALFEDKESYVANAEDPEQDAWYRRLREQLTADPEWNDGEILAIGRLAPASPTQESAQATAEV